MTGLTSNPTVFEQAIGKSDFYDEAIRRKAGEGESGKGLFFELALEDLKRTDNLFRPVHDTTGGVDGCRSSYRERADAPADRATRLVPCDAGHGAVASCGRSTGAGMRAPGA